MPASLGLKLYNLGNRREGPARPSERPARPLGRLVWLHAPSAGQASPMLALARRLVEEDGVSVVLTCPIGLPPREGVILQPPPEDTPGRCPRLSLTTGGPSLRSLPKASCAPSRCMKRLTGAFRCCWSMAAPRSSCANATAGIRA